MSKRKWAMMGTALVFAAAAPDVVRAHAFPDHAVPAVGGMIEKAPTQVQIWFTEKLEPAFSKVEVRDAKGARVDRGNAKVDVRNPTLLHVSLKPLAPGTYKVVWHVISVDTHATQGNFSFTVEK